MALFSKQPKKGLEQRVVQPVRKRVRRVVEVGSFLMMILPLLGVAASLWFGWSALQTRHDASQVVMPKATAAPTAAATASSVTLEFQQSNLRSRDPQGILLPAQIQGTPATSPF